MYRGAYIPNICVDCNECMNVIGNYEVGVHIADVSHFIKPDSALDIEAAFRYYIRHTYFMLSSMHCVNHGVSSLMCCLLVVHQYI